MSLVEASTLVTAKASEITQSRRRKEVHRGDWVFYWILRLFALGLVAILLTILYVLYIEAAPALQKFGWQFFFHLDWDPVNDRFGAAAFIYGTVVSSLLAVLISAPISIGAALVLTELAHPMVSTTVGFLVEMLAAIPSVVYGLWGVFVLAPVLREKVQPFLGEHFGWLPLFQGPPFGVGMLAAGIILAIMITPTICAISREVFRAIPDGQREAGLALGATRWETIGISVIRSCTSGIVGAIILGLGRALGETMAVTMVIGNRADIAVSLFAPAQTMSSIIANEYTEATSDLHVSSLMAIGLGLLFVSLIINSLARFIIWRVESRLKGAR